MNEVFDLAARIRMDMADSNAQLTSSQKQVLALEKELRNLEKTGTSVPKKISSAELSLEQQRKSAASLQNQRSRAILSNLKAEEKATQSAAAAMKKEMSAAAAATEKDVKSALGSIAPGLSGLIGATGPIGLAVAGIALVGAGAIAAGAGIYSMVTSAAEATGRFIDLNQQTGFSVETLSALEQAALTSGGSIQSITASLVIFQKGMEAANEGNKESIRLFKTLGIDIHDNEKALRQAFAILSAIPAGAQQTALSMKLFGRSGREIMAVYKEAGGDLDKFMGTLSDMGILIDTKTAAAGDKLSDSVTVIGQKMNATGRMIANEFAPMVVEGLSAFSHWLQDNQKEIKQAARDVVALLGDIRDLANFIYQISPLKLVIEIKRVISETFPSGDLFDANNKHGSHNEDNSKSYFTRMREWVSNPAPDTSSWRSGLGTNPPGANQTKEQTAATAKANKDAADKAAAEQKKKMDAVNKLTHPGGGGGGGGGGGDAAAEARKLIEIRQRILQEGFKNEEDTLKRSVSTRRITLEKYTEDAIDLEHRRITETLKALDAEEAEALKLKKGKEGALLTIKLKRLEAEHQSAKTIIDKIDALEQDQVERERTREEGLLRIKEVVDSQERDQWQYLADQRVITTEKAVEQIGEIERQAMERRENFLHGELIRAGNDRRAQMQIQMQLGELEAEQAAHNLKVQRDATKALHDRLQEQRQFTLELQRTNTELANQAIQLQRDAIQRELQISGPGQNGKRTNEANRKIDKLDIETENNNFELQKRELFLKMMSDMDKRSFEERIELYKVFVAQRDMLDKQHEAAIKAIQDRALIETRAKVQETAGQLTSIIDRSLTAGFEHGAKAGAIEFAKGILDIIRQRALTNLENAIADAIMGGILKGQQGASGGGGGGGILGMLFGVLISGLTGGLTAGIGGAGGGAAGAKSAWLAGGGLAEGGPAFAGQPVMVGDRPDRQPEIFMPRSNGHVMTQDQFRAMAGIRGDGGGGSVQNHYHTWNISSPNPASFMGRETQTQIMRKANRSLAVGHARTVQ